MEIVYSFISIDLKKLKLNTMKIPADFYRRFRLHTSLMALGTGLLMGYFASIFIPPFLHGLIRLAPVLAGGTIAVLINQILVHRFYFGEKRGAFEYVYLESTYDKTIEYQFSGIDRSGGLELGSLIIYKQLMSRAETLGIEDRFWCWMAAAKAANEGGEDRNSIRALKLAVTLRPKDVVANFKLARSFERLGSAQDAIEAYEAALNSDLIDSGVLKQFIAAQVQRVKEKGPDQRSPIPGLIYQLM